eukprot:8275873-Alexandrium_andersonii.AAC.1
MPFGSPYHPPGKPELGARGAARSVEPPAPGSGFRGVAPMSSAFRPGTGLFLAGCALCPRPPAAGFRAQAAA